MNNFKALSITYKEAPIDVREKVALDEVASRKFLNYIYEILGVHEALVLSTCNRTEIFYVSDDELSKELIKGFSVVLNRDIEGIEPYFKLHSSHKKAVVRLFRVSVGLESQVVGDMQITNQIKNAYQWSSDEGLAGPFMHRIMHTIFYTNKRIVQETPFRDGAASLSYVAKDLVEDLAENLTHPVVLAVGVGEIGRDFCSNLKGTELDVYVANRTFDKAEKIAKEFGFNTVPFEDISEFIYSKADIVVSSVSAPHPIINENIISSRELSRHKYFIDLSVPRSISPGLADSTGVVCYSIDELKTKATKTIEKRMASIVDVEHIVAEAIEEFEDWAKSMTVSPTIKKLKQALEQIRKEELERYLKNATPRESQLAEQVTKSIVQKVLKLPVIQLKAACQRGEEDALIDVLNNLFNLEAEKTLNE